MSKIGIPKISSKPSRPNKLRWILMVIGLVFVATVLALVIARYETNRKIAAERVRFEQADKDVRTIHSTVLQSLGKPLKDQTIATCSRPNAELVSVPLTCSTSYEAFYVTSDESQADSLYQRTRDITRSVFSPKNTTHSSNLTGNKFGKLSGSYQQIFETYTDPLSRMNCRSSYIYYGAASKPFDDYPVTTVSSVVALTLDCSGDASVKYYTD